MYTTEHPDVNFYSAKTTKGNEIGYPVHVYYLELSKMYMHRIRWHWHPEIEVLIMNHGEADLVTDDKKIHLKTGQGILINENVMHSLESTDEQADCSLYSTIFHPSFLFGYGNTVMSSKLLSPVLNFPAFRTLLLDEGDPATKKLIDTIDSVIAVNMTKKFGFELTTKSYLCQFWVHLLEQITLQNTDSTRHNELSMDEARVKDALLYIQEHYSEHISLEDLADSAHISKSECCRCFKRALNLTPIEYLMRYRIYKASNLIQTDDHVSRSISDLAFSVGFNNVSYFTKVFKEYMKCTPREYKKSIKSNPNENTFNIMPI